MGIYFGPYSNTDTDFNKNSLLLTGNGTNGAQNSTFANSIFPGGHAVYFDGSDWLTATGYTGTIAQLSGDFTIEVWVNPINIAGATGYVFCVGDDRGGYGIAISPSRIPGFVYYVSGLYSTNLNSPTAISYNEWCHIAAVRLGSTLTLYVNGVAVNSTTMTVTQNGLSNLSGEPYLKIGRMSPYGYYFTGYVSNLRIIKGVALYNTNFTPSYDNLQAIPGTSVLTCQGPTIVDKSVNNFSITVSGDAAVQPTFTQSGTVPQGTFSPFSLPDRYWSNYFDGSGDYLQASWGSINIRTGSFTIEAWCNLSSNASFTLFSASQTTAVDDDFYLNSSGSTVYLGSLASGINNITFSTSLLPVGSWFHVAVTFDGITYRVFINGSVVGTSTTLFSDLTMVSTTIGARATEYTNYTTGYISNFRVLKGTALYLANFTPPTAPLTAIENTTLLTCQTNRFKDNSSSNNTITSYGNVTVTPVSPFRSDMMYYAPNNGGSGYFGGGSYITTASNAALNFGTGDFTIEAWVYWIPGGSDGPNIMGRSALTGGGGVNGGAGSWIFNYLNTTNPSTTVNFLYQSSVGTGTVSFGTTYQKAWHHLVVVRSSGVIRGYNNGVLTATDSSASAAGNFDCALNFTLGQTDQVPWHQYVGYLSSVRIVKGSAVYTSAFNPTLAAPQTVAGTSLLVNFTNASIYDATGKNDIETVGNAQISTGVKKYGTGSMYFNGSTDYLSVPDNVSLEFGSGDFTVEAWLYPLALPASGSQHTVVGKWETTNTFSWICNYYNNAGTMQMAFGYSTDGASVAASYYSNAAITTNSWCHLAYVRSGSSFKMFFNGTEVTSSATISGTIYNGPQAVNIGRHGSSLNYVNGYIDDLRITKGLARYTANFVPPSAHGLK